MDTPEVARGKGAMRRVRGLAAGGWGQFCRWHGVFPPFASLSSFLALHSPSLLPLPTTADPSLLWTFTIQILSLYGLTAAI